MRVPARRRKSVLSRVRTVEKKRNVSAPTRLVKSIGIVDGAELGLFAAQTDDGIIRGVTKKDQDSISITLVRPTEGTSSSYSYHTRSGAVECNNDEFSGDWIGAISASRTLACRVRHMVNSVCDDFKLPNTTADLQAFIDGRPQERRDWYTVQFPNKKQGSVCLPYLLVFFKDSDESLEEGSDTAVVSNATIAPHYQKKGYGTLLHLCLAQHLRDEGFKMLVSDLVGMNTTGELAVWEKLQKQGREIKKMEPMSHICIPRMLHAMRIIDDQMYKQLNKQGTHFGGRIHSLAKVEKTDFPQYLWDLSKPILTA
jgi:hypothetical protein